MSADENTTALLLAWNAGSQTARSRLVQHLYGELRGLAERQLGRGPAEVTLQPTELVHELFMRLVDQRSTTWANRAHFFAIAARLIRRILLQHARDRRRDKRGGGAVLLPLDGVEVAAPAGHPDLLDLDQALRRLRRIDALACRIVELRYFGGLSLEETAELVGASRASVVRRWRYARAWLAQTLSGAPRDAAHGSPAEME